MLVLSQENDYNFANAVITVVDNTALVDDTTTPTPEVPNFNFLIPTVQPIGITNQLTLYYPGEPNRYLKAHGTPNALTSGFGPEMVHTILSKNVSDVGVYTINLRGPSATMSNIMVAMKYKVEEDVPYTNETGDPYYVDSNGQLTTEPTNNTAVVRDVLHVKFVASHIDDCKTWTGLFTALNALYDATADVDGYKTIPWFATMYRGASKFGDSVYFNMVPSVAQYDGNIYYALNVYDGISTTTTSSIYSMDPAAGEKYGMTYYIEKQFNDTFTNLKFTTAETNQEIIDLFNKYLYTLDDFISGTMATPSAEFASVDPFAVSTFGIQVDTGSINSKLTNAFALAGGTDGTETRDELFKMFFNGEILNDVDSVIRYRFNYIPDINYDDDTKEAIIALVNKRIYMTTATIMVGTADTFASSMVDHQANYFDNMPNIRQLAKIQSPMRYNTYTRRTMTYPATYFDTIALMDHINTYGNPYQPFAGSDARWYDFIEETMQYPQSTADVMQSLSSNRINVVMKDANAGAYLSDQLMNTTLTSDRTEFNNSILMSNMLYDLVRLVHINNFKFNEAEEVRLFKEAVNDTINNKYAAYSASLSVDVYRMGTVGRAKSTNKIVVTIDLKDISKYANVELNIVDE